jgi:hypothetical protein
MGVQVGPEYAEVANCQTTSKDSRKSPWKRVDLEFAIKPPKT